MNDVQPFDRYADEYDAALGRGLALAGEDKAYFARGRVAWLRRSLDRLGRPAPASVLDFGCGTGSAVPHFRDLLAPTTIVGIDQSVASIDIAARAHAGDGVSFVGVDGFEADGTFDLAFCNGVFHHIPPDERMVAMELVRRSLKPGGVFALWENNPWNPGARLVMRRIPFDRDAIMLSSAESRRLMRAAGFTVLETTYQFVFPHLLEKLRPLEPPMSILPVGAQYQVLAMAPDGTR
jgi:SAM-dependent methyltransferase